LPKLNFHGQDIEIDDRQNSVGGYVDDLMERIRKMPPKKRSKFYQMLDEEQQSTEQSIVARNRQQSTRSSYSSYEQFDAIDRQR
jgi:hypothetical protein